MVVTSFQKILKMVTYSFWQWSLSCVMDATQKLPFYLSGIYHQPNCSNNTVNHAVLVVGYGSEGDVKDGNNYWLIKNRYTCQKKFLYLKF